MPGDMEDIRLVLVEGADELEGADQGVVSGLGPSITDLGHQLFAVGSSGLGVNGLGDGAHRRNHHRDGHGPNNYYCEDFCRHALFGDRVAAGFRIYFPDYLIWTHFIPSARKMPVEAAHSGPDQLSKLSLDGFRDRINLPPRSLIPV